MIVSPTVRFPDSLSKGAPMKPFADMNHEEREELMRLVCDELRAKLPNDCEFALVVFPLKVRRNSEIVTAARVPPRVLLYVLENCIAHLRSVVERITQSN